ncbi:tetratricopeptide repeat protein [Candidatus Margulisiibacteriota bacterium]
MRMLRMLLITTMIAVLFGGYAFCFTLTDDLKTEIEEKEWLVKVHPEDPAAYFDLAITYAYSNRIEDALSMLKKVDELDKDFPPKALEIYSKEVRFFPDDWKTRFRFAFALYFNGKKEEAIREFKQIIEKHPDNVFSYAYIATIYGELDNVDEAIDWCKKAIEVDSNVAATHLLLAAAYYKNGQGLLGFQETFEALRLRALGY